MADPITSSVIGIADKVSEAITNELQKRNVDIEFTVASNPEFLKEGDAVSDFMKPDRIVIGTNEARAEQLLGSYMRLLTATMNAYFLWMCVLPNSLNMPPMQCWPRKSVL